MAAKSASKSAPAKAARKSEVKARVQAQLDQALAFLRKVGGNVRMGEIAQGIGIWDGEEGSSTREMDRLYIAMKSDTRFVKNEPRKATYGLTAKGKRAKLS